MKAPYQHHSPHVKLTETQQAELARGFGDKPVTWEADMTSGPDRAFSPDAVVIRRTRWGWSAFSGDGITGAYGDDSLIASSDHVGGLAEYILTLEPSEIIIQPGERQNELPCPIHPGL